MNALLWSGWVWSEFAWSWSCDAFQGGDAFMPGRAAAPALSWLGVSMLPWEAAQELPMQACSGWTNSSKSSLLISNYLPVAKKIDISVWNMVTHSFHYCLTSVFKSRSPKTAKLFKRSEVSMCIYVYTYITNLFLSCYVKSKSYSHSHKEQKLFA